ADGLRPLPGLRHPYRLPEQAFDRGCGRPEPYSRRRRRLRDIREVRQTLAREMSGGSAYWKQRNRPPARLPVGGPLWNEDKMKKMKLSLAIVIITGRC